MAVLKRIFGAFGVHGMRLEAVRKINDCLVRRSLTTLPEPQTEIVSASTVPFIERSNDVDSLKTALSSHDYFNVRNLVKMKDLYQARVHWGHKVGVRNPYMTSYLFGNRLGMDIFNLDQTLTLLQDALNITAHVAYQDGVILFLSRNRQVMPIVESTAKECGEYAHCRFWRGGIFTNATVQFQAMTRLPDLCIFISSINTVFAQHRAVIDSNKLLIPSIAILDSNCDPRLVSYPVPGNDDTPCAIQLYCNLFKEAILRGKAKRKEDYADE